MNVCIICNCTFYGFGEICEQCEIDKARGYAVGSLAGRCVNGAERDHGTLFHALPVGNGYVALCGAKPGRRSVGWSDYGKHNEVTCPRCIAKLAKIKQVAQ